MGSFHTASYRTFREQFGYRHRDKETWWNQGMGPGTVGTSLRTMNMSQRHLKVCLDSVTVGCGSYWAERRSWFWSHLCQYLLSPLWSSFLFVKWQGRTPSMILNRPHPHGEPGLSQSFMRMEEDKEDELQARSILGAPTSLIKGCIWHRLDWKTLIRFFFCSPPGDWKPGKQLPRCLWIRAGLEINHNKLFCLHTSF